jgi:hypothetical protein
LAKSENFAASFRFRSARVNWSVIYAPMQPRPDHVPARGPILHKSPRSTLTQTQHLRGRRCGREREFLRLLCAGHCGLQRRPRPGNGGVGSTPRPACPPGGFAVTGGPVKHDLYRWRLSRPGVRGNRWKKLIVIVRRAVKIRQPRPLRQNLVAIAVGADLAPGLNAPQTPAGVSGFLTNSA